MSAYVNESEDFKRMKENQIEVHGELYDIVFILHEKGDRYLMLLSNGQETFCTACLLTNGKTTLETATDEEIEKCVAAYNEAINNSIAYNGEIYTITARPSGICLAFKEGQDDILYAFEKTATGYAPLTLDEAARTYYANAYRFELEENHDFLEETEPGMTSLASLASARRLTELDGYDIYLHVTKDNKSMLVFVDQKESKVVVSPSEQQKILKRFRTWENDQYETHRHFTLANLPVSA